MDATADATMQHERESRHRRPVALVHGRTALSFTWQGDRWRHEVRLPATAWHSLEAAGPTGDPRWPDSPAIVELSRVEVADRPAIVGVGLAGRSHFSLSVVPHPHREDTLVFEIACRIVEPPGWLGSSYRTAAEDGAVVRVAADPGEPEAGLPRTVRWAYTIGPGGIAGVACGGPADRSHFA